MSAAVSSSQAFPPEHQFFREIRELTHRPTDRDIIEIAQRNFSKDISSDLLRPILGAVKVLKNNVSNISSVKNALKEVAGAIDALQHLLGNASYSKKDQSQIKSEIIALGEVKKKLDNIALLREVVTDQSDEIMHVLNDDAFIKVFMELRELFGRTIKLETPTIAALINLWNSPEGATAFKNYLAEMKSKRAANLETLDTDITIRTRKGQKETIRQFPVERTLRQTEGKHVGKPRWESLYDTLLMTSAEKLKRPERVQLKILQDEIRDRTLVFNTQLHEDSIPFAFNVDYPAQDTERAGTFKEIVTKAHQLNRDELSVLQESLKKEGLEKKERETIEKRIAVLERLENYYPRAGSLTYQKSVWSPLMGPNDPIVPVYRTIGFAGQEGFGKETKIVLDFTEALGKGVVLQVEERQILANLLKAADSVISELGKEPKELPHPLSASMTAVLEKFKEHPNLQKLDDNQKAALVMEALRFAFEVNYHLIANQLKLT